MLLKSLPFVQCTPAPSLGLTLALFARYPHCSKACTFLYSSNLTILWNTYACLHYSQNNKNKKKPKIQQTSFYSCLWALHTQRSLLIHWPCSVSLPVLLSVISTNLTETRAASQHCITHHCPSPTATAIGNVTSTLPWP